MRSLSSYPISLELQVCQCNQQHPGLKHSHLWRFRGNGVEYLGQSPHLWEYRTGSGHINAEGVCPGWEIYGSRCIYFKHEKHHGPETLRQPGMLGTRYKLRVPAIAVIHVRKKTSSFRSFAFTWSFAQAWWSSGKFFTLSWFNAESKISSGLSSLGFSPLRKHSSSLSTSFWCSSVMAGEFQSGNGRLGPVTWCASWFKVGCKLVGELFVKFIHDLHS